MIHDTGTPLPAHVLAAVPDDFPGTLYEILWQRGAVVVGICCGDFDNLDIVTPLWGVSIEENEVRAVKMAVASFTFGYVQHRLTFDLPVSDDEVVEALAAATMRDDLDIADLLDAAAERGLGPVSPTHMPTVSGLRH